MTAIQLIQLIQGLLGVIIPGIAQLEGIITGSATTTAALADADATYQQVIANAQAVLAMHQPSGLAPAASTVKPISVVKPSK